VRILLARDVLEADQEGTVPGEEQVVDELVSAAGPDPGMVPAVIAVEPVDLRPVDPAAVVVGHEALHLAVGIAQRIDIRLLDLGADDQISHLHLPRGAQLGSRAWRNPMPVERRDATVAVREAAQWPAVALTVELAVP